MEEAMKELENAQAAQVQADQQEREARSRASQEIGQFVALFPGVMAHQVPQTVWQQVRDGQNLALAYALYKIEALENALTRKERSAQLSTGSVSSAGSTTLGGTVASFWDAYQI